MVSKYPSPTLYTELGNLGYTGAFNDRLNKYLGNLGLTGSLTDRIHKYNDYSWVPRSEGDIQATIHLDFVNRRYWWGGSERSFSDLTVVSGSPSLVTRGLLFASGDKMSIPAASLFNLDLGTLIVEWDGDASPTDSVGIVFCAHYNNANMLSIGIYGSNLSNNTLRRSCYCSTRAAGVQITENTIFNQGLQTGIGRAAVSWSAGSSFHGAAFGSTSGAVTPNIQGSSPGLPTVLALGYRVIDSKVFTGTIRRITYWPVSSSDAWLTAQAAYSTLPLHILGDSFVNTTSFVAPWVRSISDQFRVVSVDGSSGSTLTQQATGYASSSSVIHDKTLIVLDGGLDTDTPTSKSAIDSIVASAGHGRWFYVQPSPGSLVAGSPERVVWDNTVSKMREYVGESHFIETLPLALSLGNGSADDLSDIANNIWPRSLRTDTIHPTTAAWSSVIGSQIRTKLDFFGW